MSNWILPFPTLRDLKSQQSVDWFNVLLNRFTKQLKILKVKSNKWNPLFKRQKNYFKKDYSLWQLEFVIQAEILTSKILTSHFLIKTSNYVILKGLLRSWFQLDSANNKLKRKLKLQKKGKKESNWTLTNLFRKKILCTKSLLYFKFLAILAWCLEKWSFVKPASPTLMIWLSWVSYANIVVPIPLRQKIVDKFMMRL